MQIEVNDNPKPVDLSAGWDADKHGQFIAHMAQSLAAGRWRMKVRLPCGETFYLFDVLFRRGSPTQQSIGSDWWDANPAYHDYNLARIVEAMEGMKYRRPKGSPRISRHDGREAIRLLLLAAKVMP
jgi:hypothetical protein